MRLSFVCALCGCALALIDHDFTEALWAGLVAMVSYHALRNESDAKSLDSEHK